jgi:hypothetical protein
MVFVSPKKNVANSIRKIKKGHGSQKVVKSLNKILAEHPELMEDAVYQLVGIIQTDKVENFTYAIDVMLNIAEVEPDLFANSSDTIIGILEFPEKSLDINYILKTIDILGIIAYRYPELMQPSVKIFLQMLKNSNSQIRSASFYILDMIAKPYPEYFSNYTLDLIRSLHGLHIDERLYATRLIGDVARISPDLIDESFEVLSDLAYKHPDTNVRQEAYDVLKKFRIEDEVKTEEPEEELLEFEKDFIGLIDIKTESDDFGELADALAESIKSIDFKESASEMLKSLGMDHLIVKPVGKGSEQESVEKKSIEQEQPFLKKLPVKQVIENKKTLEHTIDSIDQIVKDPNPIPNISVVKYIANKKEEEAQQSDIFYNKNAKTKEELKREPSSETDVAVPEPIKNKKPEIGEEIKPEIKEENKPNKNLLDQISDNTLDMIYTIFEEFSNEDWLYNVGLTTKDGNLLAASKPDSIDLTALKKISNILRFEETSPKKKGFRNRVSIELSDKLIVALCMDYKYNLTVFTVPDVQFVIVLYHLNKIADKLEQIL